MFVKIKNNKHILTYCIIINSIGTIIRISKNVYDIKVINISLYLNEFKTIWLLIELTTIKYDRFVKLYFYSYCIVLVVPY